VSIADTSKALETRQFSARELVDASLAQIEASKRLNCFIRLLADQARAEAAAADERIAKGERRGPLDGIPIAVKDNIDVAGVPTTAGMAVRRTRIASEDAFCVTRLRRAGAIVVGKASMHEAALGATNDNPHFGRCFNPHGTNRTPGGSSGGSAAAVAAGLVHGALGTDTMGSIRIPASYCGVVGLKPTYGFVSTRGVCYVSWRLDHVGPIARTVADTRILLDAIAGYDLLSPESRDGAPAGQRTLRLGVLKSYEKTALSLAVAAAFDRALAIFRDLGYAIVEVTIDDFDPAYARRCGLLMAEADAALVHEKDLVERPEMFSEETRAMLRFGSTAPALKLAKAERVVGLAAASVQRLLQGLDAIVSPATPQTAFGFDEPIPESQGDFTALANFAGCPAVSIPIGSDGGGMPIGLQLMGSAWSDARLLEIAQELEAAATKT
jgi:Asp-tRNA(Asn)/Glu-tRNA(Gln) amidotransferase A subunit family amidase